MDNLSASQIAPIKSGGASEQLARLEYEVTDIQDALSSLVSGVNNMQIKFAKTDQDRIDNIAEQVRVGSGMDVGCIVPYCSDTNIPDNYLLCDNRAVSREEYAELFSVIGIRFGSGDGETTFNLPNIAPTKTSDDINIYYIIKSQSAEPRKLDAYAEYENGSLKITTAYGEKKQVNEMITVEQEVVPESIHAVSCKAVYQKLKRLSDVIDELSARLDALDGNTTG